MDLIVIAGAPGVGKSTVSHALARSLGSPCLEFSVLREPHLDPEWSNASPAEHEMAWENLQFIVRNYLRYGYRNVVVTDLREERVRQVAEVFGDLEYRIVTLVIADVAELRRRVGARVEGFMNVEAAVDWNAAVRARPRLNREMKIEVAGCSQAEVLEAVRRAV
jgi:broad-specificity NMP kinase